MFPRLTKRAHKVFSLINEWRDTLFYSLLFALTLADLAFGWNVQVRTFANCAEIREVARAIAWTVLPGRTIRYGFMAIFITESLFLFVRFCYALIPEVPVFHVGNAVFSLIHLSIATLALRQVGGVRCVWEAYRETLFDYPRKIKPPGERRRMTAEEALRVLLQNERNGNKPAAEPAQG